jgi:uncharacterized protein
MKTEKPTACVTGASSGIGAEYARQLAAKGYNLILVARRKQRLDELGQQLKDRYGIEVEALPADLSLEAEIIQLADFLKTVPNLEVLVNNAGFGIPGAFYKTDIDVSLTMLSVHVLATARLTQAIIPGMVERGIGYIINVSSISAFSAALGNPMYSATKSFLTAFSDALATELAKTGVKVQAVCPGMTRTEFHDSPGYARYRDEKVIPEFAWMSAEKVVAGSLKSVLKGQVIYIPGFGNRFGAFLGSLGLLRWWVRMYLKLTGKHPSEALEDY